LAGATESNTPSQYDQSIWSPRRLLDPAGISG